MKRALLGTVTAVALLWSSAAGAVDIVSDPLVEANTLQSLAKEILAAEKRVEMINNQIIQIQNLVATLNAVSHGNLAALSSLSPELGALGLTSPLGGDVAGLVSALGGLGGSVAATGTLAQQMMSTDNFYLPSGADFRAVAMNQAAAALAQQRALASLALDSSTKRLASLTTLRNQLGSTADVKAAADATARLTGEQATAQAQTNQLLAAQMLQSAQLGSSKARDEQAWRCSAESFVANAKAAVEAANSGMVTLINTSSSSVTCTTAPAPADSSAAVAGLGSGGTGSTTPVGGSSALDTMMAQSWGQTAASNATALGVNPSALAATCVLESNCSANVGGTGTISGAFQMSNGTYAETVAAVQASNPDLAAQISSKNDPASQSIAAAQYLKQGALSLQSANIANPTALDVRGYYQFGPANAASVAQAPDNQLMASILTGLPSSALAGNNITSTTTVGQWRQSVTSKIGDAASQPVLIGA